MVSQLHKLTTIVQCKSLASGCEPHSVLKVFCFGKHCSYHPQGSMYWSDDRGCLNIGQGVSGQSIGSYGADQWSGQLYQQSPPSLPMLHSSPALHNVTTFVQTIYTTLRMATAVFAIMLNNSQYSVRLTPERQSFTLTASHENIRSRTLS
jgi:hypothetical protein